MEGAPASQYNLTKSARDPLLKIVSCSAQMPLSELLEVGLVVNTYEYYLDHFLD